MNAAASSNRLLAALRKKDRQHVLAACESVDLTFGDVLWEPGQRIRQVYFPVDSFVSLLVPVHGRDNYQVAVVGREGMLGESLLHGVLSSHLQAIVHGSGSALRMNTATFYREVKLVPALHVHLARYVHVLQTQLALTLACNNFHALDRRLASWLLSTQDRAEGRPLHVTQKGVGQLLGVRRASVSNAAGRLQKRQLIHYSRGYITILDRPALETAACGCYQLAKAAYTSALG